MGGVPGEPNAGGTLTCDRRHPHDVLPHLSARRLQPYQHALVRHQEQRLLDEGLLYPDVLVCRCNHGLLDGRHREGVVPVGEPVCCFFGIIEKTKIPWNGVWSTVVFFLSRYFALWGVPLI